MSTKFTIDQKRWDHALQERSTNPNRLMEQGLPRQFVKNVTDGVPVPLHQINLAAALLGVTNWFLMGDDQRNSVMQNAAQFWDPTIVEGSSYNTGVLAFRDMRSIIDSLPTENRARSSAVEYEYGTLNDEEIERELAFISRHKIFSEITRPRTIWMASTNPTFLVDNREPFKKLEEALAGITFESTLMVGTSIDELVAVAEKKRDLESELDFLQSRAHTTFILDVAHATEIIRSVRYTERSEFNDRGNPETVDRIIEEYRLGLLPLIRTRYFLIAPAGAEIVLVHINAHHEHKSVVDDVDVLVAKNDPDAEHAQLLASDIAERQDAKVGR